MLPCYHYPLTVRQVRETHWFRADGDDYKALFKIISDTKFRNDMKKCKKFVHTGNLESFHSLKLLYLPKSTGFSRTTTIILTMLAPIKNNVYLKDKTLIKSYDVVQWSRAMKQHVIKNRRVHDNVSFKKEYTS